MGRLKPREARLLIVFILALVIVASIFLYGIYQERKTKLAQEIQQLETQKEELYTYRAMQAELNEKVAWLNKNQPLAIDELKANEYLDSLVSIGAIEAEGLTYLNTRETPASREPYYWAFERTITMEGSIQQIVSFLAKLQSETSFRAITKLHIFPPKKKEPETLRCEFTVQQRYATPEVIAMTTPGVAATSIRTPARPPVGAGPSESVPENDESTPAASEGEGSAEVADDALETEIDGDTPAMGNAPPPNRSTSVERTVRLPDGSSSGSVRRPPVNVPRPASGVVPPTEAGAPEATEPTRPRVALPPGAASSEDEEEP